MAMFINEYAVRAHELARYPTEQGLVYTALGLTGEAGEYAEKVKKFIRDGTWDKDLAIKELGDVLWYLNAAAVQIGSSLEEVASINLAKLYDRKERGVLKGSGDTR